MLLGIIYYQTLQHWNPVNKKYKTIAVQKYKYIVV